MKKILIVVGVVFGIFLVFGIYVAREGDLDIEPVADTLGAEVIAPLSSEECKGKKYEEVVAAFKSAGFKNVNIVPLKNNTNENLSKTVESVVIGNRTGASFNKNEKFRENETVAVNFYPSVERFAFIKDYNVRDVIQRLTLKYPEIIITEEMVRNTKNAGGDLTIIDLGDMYLHFGYGDGDSVKSFDVISKVDRTDENISRVFDVANKLYTTVTEKYNISDGVGVNNSLNDILGHLTEDRFNNGRKERYSSSLGRKSSITYVQNTEDYDGENYFDVPFILTLTYGDYDY